MKWLVLASSRASALLSCRRRLLSWTRRDLRALRGLGMCVIHHGRTNPFGGGLLRPWNSALSVVSGWYPSPSSRCGCAVWAWVRGSVLVLPWGGLCGRLPRSRPRWGSPSGIDRVRFGAVCSCASSPRRAPRSAWTIPFALLSSARNSFCWEDHSRCGQQPGLRRRSKSFFDSSFFLLKCIP